MRPCRASSAATISGPASETESSRNERSRAAELGVDLAAFGVPVRLGARVRKLIHAGAQLARAVGGEHGAAGERGERLGKGRLAARCMPGDAEHARKSRTPRETLGKSEQLVPRAARSSAATPVS
jgi:hypothetical protein